MNRKDFIKSLSLLSIAGLAQSHKNQTMVLSDLERLSQSLPPSDRMPVVFVGHGNPMNALGQNKFSKTWAELGKKLPKPLAVLCISAHWLTNGTSVNLSSKPKTIHDFGGFPDELFNVQYPAPGAPEYAKLTQKTVSTVKIAEDHEWGLDHGAWSVLIHMYPHANVPIFQMSIDYGKGPAFHYELGKQLSSLRNKGVLIIASGNAVHNLGMVSWGDSEKKFDWAIEFDQIVKKSIEDNRPETLVAFEKFGSLGTMAHPTIDHYLPLMYTLGLRQKEDQFSFFNDSFDLGSISMRGVIFS